MNSRRIHVGTLALVGLIAFTPTTVSAAQGASRIRTAVTERLDNRDGIATDEPKYQGKPLTYWLKIIDDRDDEMISLAFDAVRSLGPMRRLPFRSSRGSSQRHSCP